MFGISTIIKELKKIRRLLEAIYWVLFATPRFGAITVDDSEENGIVISNVTLGLLPVTPTTKTQHLTVSAEGLTSAFELEPTVTEVKFSVTSGAEVSAILVYADASGNLSTAAETTFFANDTVPPEGPSGFGATVVDDTEEALPEFPPLG